MLYIKFEIQDSSKFEDFQKLYKHMVEVRQPGFKFDDEGPDFDWDTMPEEEQDAALKELNAFLDQQAEPEKYRCKELLPDYVNAFLKAYLQAEYEKSGLVGEPDVLSIFNYLEFGFEVDMDKLTKINDHSGIVEFSTANYPFGGMERFIMTLAAYDLKPLSCFDGFNECQFNWTSNFDYNTVVSPKKNRFSTITNFFRNSFFKKSLILIFLLISNSTLAQNSSSKSVFNKTLNDEKLNKLIILEKPEFPTPENDLLFFLSEDKILNPTNYNGNIINVEKIYTEYSKAGNMVYADTIITERVNSFKLFKELSSEPIIDRLGINSVTKTGVETFALQSTDSLSYLDVVYTLKNNKIIAITEDTSVYVNDVKYFYNSQGQLVKKTYFNEYGTGVINEAEYNSNAQIISQSSFDNTDGLDVTKKTYTNNDRNLLTYFEMTAATYFIPFENEEENIEINKVDYLKYKQPDTYVNTHSINFEYNERDQLIKISEERKAFTDESGIQNQTKSLYVLSHTPNKLIVEASLPEQRTYEYIFDVSGNPKEINSYLVDPDNTWIHKKTTFKILYTE